MPDVNTNGSQRKYRLTPEQVLALNKIEIQPKARYYTTCPLCSHLRQRCHQKLKVLGVTRPDEDRVFWGCNHCGWTGPGKHDGGAYRNPSPRPKTARRQGVPFTASTRTIYNYSRTLRKVKVVNGDSKRMWWEFLDKGWWDSGSNGIETERLMYRIDQAKKMSRVLGLPICLVEGEKDVDCLMFKGIPASCNAHGASEPGKAPKWYACHSDQIAGYDICVFNDNDVAGVAHRDATCALSVGKAKTILVMDHALHFPQTKDISEWFKRGGDKTTLLDFIEGAPEYVPCQSLGSNNAFPITTETRSQT